MRTPVLSVTRDLLILIIARDLQHTWARASFYQSENSFPWYSSFCKKT